MPRVALTKTGPPTAIFEHKELRSPISLPSLWQCSHVPPIHMPEQVQPQHRILHPVPIVQALVDGAPTCRPSSQQLNLGYHVIRSTSLRRLTSLSEDQRISNHRSHWCSAAAQQSPATRRFVFALLLLLPVSQLTRHRLRRLVVDKDALGGLRFQCVELARVPDSRGLDARSLAGRRRGFRGSCPAIVWVWEGGWLCLWRGVRLSVLCGVLGCHVSFDLGV